MLHSKQYILSSLITVLDTDIVQEFYDYQLSTSGDVKNSSQYREEIKRILVIMGDVFNKPPTIKNLLLRKPSEITRYL